MLCDTHAAGVGDGAFFWRPEIVTAFVINRLIIQFLLDAGLNEATEEILFSPLLVSHEPLIFRVYVKCF